MKGGFYDVSRAVCWDPETDESKVMVWAEPNLIGWDEETSSENALVALALLELANFADRSSYLNTARQTLEVFAGSIAEYAPRTAGYLLAFKAYQKAEEAEKAKRANLDRSEAETQPSVVDSH
jgi:uncharacterized protein YyaL (SSP411 family)